MNSRRPPLSTEVTVLGLAWKFHLLSERKFQQVVKDDNAAALTCRVDRVVYFSRNEFTWPIVKHEIMHVYIDALCIDSAGEHLSVGAFEEQVCELYSKHHAQMLLTASVVYKNLGGKQIEEGEVKCLSEALKNLMSLV